MGVDKIKAFNAKEIFKRDKSGRAGLTVGTASNRSRSGQIGFPMNRRSFLRVAGALGAGLPITAVGASEARKQKAPLTTAGASHNRKQKAPFKVLFSNDTTNMLACVSPQHPGSPYDFDALHNDKSVGPLTTAIIQAGVDEVAGVDVDMLQPGLGWIAWWKSKVHPAAEDYRYVQEQTGVEPDAFGRYILEGNDLVQVFVDRCRQRGQAPFVSWRLNDPQLLDFGPQNAHSRFVSRFYMEHPEYRIGPDKNSRDQRGQNWAIPEVRDYKFSFIRELCENYDIDGFELDFMRAPRYFRLGETTVKQRARIMTEFVARVRQLLDETARGGRYRWLCARVPCLLVAHDPVGIDLPAMVDAGLEMVNLSDSYSTIQQTDLPIVRKMVPQAAVYLEMTHTTLTGPRIPGAWDSAPYLRTTDQQFYTAAHLAYARGGDGVSLFNFAYYREFGHALAERGPFNEPPFHVLKHLGDRAWLENQRQWFLLSKDWSNPTLLGEQPLPKTFHPGEGHIFMLDLAPNAQNQKGLLRLRAVRDASGRTWSVKLNGAQLEAAEYVAKPIDNPYNAFLGQSGEYACFSCPPGIAQEGHNELAVTMDHGEPVTVEYLDLVFS